MMKYTFFLLIILLNSCVNYSNKKPEIVNLYNVDTSNYKIRIIEKYSYLYEKNKLMKSTNILTSFFKGKLNLIDTSYTNYMYDNSDSLIQKEEYTVVNGKKLSSNIIKYYKNYQIEFELYSSDTIGTHIEWVKNYKIIKDYRKRKFTDGMLLNDTTLYFYDSDNHLIKQITKDMANNKVRIFYETFDSTDNQTTIIRKNESDKTVETTNIIYDYLGNKQYKIVETPNFSVDSTIYSNNKETCFISNSRQRKEYHFMKYDLKGNLIEKCTYIIEK